MRIVWLLPGFNGSGGAERSLAAMAPHYLDAGVDLEVAILTARDDLRPEMERLGVPITRLDGRGGTRGAVVRLHRLLRRRRVDLLHTSLVAADMVGRVAAVGTGVPVLTTLAVTPPDEFTIPGVSRLSLAGARGIDSVSGRFLTTHFHAVTEGVKLAAAQRMHWPLGRISVVERGRDPDKFGVATPQRRAAAREVLDLAPDADVVLGVGRQVVDKGQVGLVEAVGLLQERYPRLVLLIAGDEGNATPGIAAACPQLPDPTRVRVFGHRDDVAELLAAADVFALPSWREGASGATLEAMAFGLPIVASDLMGLRGVLEDERNALLVPRADPAALARALERILEDGGLAAALGAAAQRDFEERFTLARSAEQMLALSRQVAVQGRRRSRSRSRISTRRELDLPSARR